MQLSKTFISIFIVLLYISCNRNTLPQTITPAATQHNTLSSEEIEQGWQLLFDGKSFTGWKKYGGAAVGKAWIIKDSSIFLDASAKKADWQTNDGGDIVTNQSFSNFHLKYEWKIDRGGNSGIIFYVHEDSTKYQYPWQTGPEMQVLDNDKHADAKIIKHRAGDLYDLMASSSEPVKPALEWNYAEIKSVNGQLDFYLNGAHILSTQLWNDAWKALVAASKFKDMPSFGIYKTGKISLQDHGDNVWFRNIKIRKL